MANLCGKKTVEAYADHQKMWMEDFVKVWDKMSRNGYNVGELIQGPTGFWSHLNKTINQCIIGVTFCGVIWALSMLTTATF